MKVYTLFYMEDMGVDWHATFAGVVSSEDIAKEWVTEDPEINFYKESYLDNVEF